MNKGKSGENAGRNVAIGCLGIVAIVTVLTAIGALSGNDKPDPIPSTPTPLAPSDAAVAPVEETPHLRPIYPIREIKSDDAKLWMLIDLYDSIEPSLYGAMINTRLTLIGRDIQAGAPEAHDWLETLQLVIRRPKLDYSGQKMAVPALIVDVPMAKIRKVDLSAGSSDWPLDLASEVLVLPEGKTIVTSYCSDPDFRSSTPHFCKLAVAAAKD